MNRVSPPTAAYGNDAVLNLAVQISNVDSADAGAGKTGVAGTRGWFQRDVSEPTAFATAFMPTDRWADVNPVAAGVGASAFCPRVQVLNDPSRPRGSEPASKRARIGVPGPTRRRPHFVLVLSTT